MREAVYKEMERFVDEARKLGAYNVLHVDDNLGAWIVNLDLNRREHGFSRAYMCLLCCYVAIQMLLVDEPTDKILQYLRVQWAVLPTWESKDKNLLSVG